MPLWYGMKPAFLLVSIAPNHVRPSHPRSVPSRGSSQTNHLPVAKKARVLVVSWTREEEIRKRDVGIRCTLPAKNPFCSSVCHGTPCQCGGEGGRHALIGDGISNQPQWHYTPLAAAGHEAHESILKLWLHSGRMVSGTQLGCCPSHSDPVSSLSSSSTAANCAAGPFASQTS